MNFAADKVRSIDEKGSRSAIDPGTFFSKCIFCTHLPSGPAASSQRSECSFPAFRFEKYRRVSAESVFLKTGHSSPTVRVCGVSMNQYGRMATRSEMAGMRSQLLW